MAALSRLSRGAFIPSEQLDGCSRWQFRAVDESGAEQGGTTDPEALREAHREGWTQGHAAGRVQALAEAQVQMDNYRATQECERAQRFAALLAAAEAQIADSQQIIARGTLEIACALARQVLRHELATNPNALEPVVREALGMLLAEGKSAAVRLSPADFDMLDAPLRVEFAGQAVAVVADAAIAPGDCLIESAGAIVDGGVANRWSRAVSSLGLVMPWDEAEGHAG